MKTFLEMAEENNNGSHMMPHAHENPPTKFTLRDADGNVLSERTLVYDEKAYKNLLEHFEKYIKALMEKHAKDLQAQSSSLVRQLLNSLPEKTEGEGWEEFFKKQNVGVCCPGDDLADGWNACRSQLIAKAIQLGVVDKE